MTKQEYSAKLDAMCSAKDKLRELGEKMAAICEATK